MTAIPNGLVDVSIQAGPIAVVDRPPHPLIGQMVVMGNRNSLTLHITAEVAAQWIQTLTPIAEKSK